MQNKFLNNGWDWLLKKFYDYVLGCQEEWLNLTEENQTDYKKCGRAPSPIFKFEINQVKQKMACLRIYYSITNEEFDWNYFDKDSYRLQMQRIRSEIRGYVSAVESISGSICEISGQRGSQRNINGWLRTLSDAEYLKIVIKND